MTDEATGIVTDSGPKSDQDLVEERDIKALEKEYLSARTFDLEQRKQYTEDRGYASGKTQKNWASDANLIGTFIDILVSFLYAKDPDVSAAAAKNVGGSSEENALFAETAGIIIPRLWKKGRVKKGLRKQVRSSLSVGPGWLKVIMTHDRKIDPVVKRELDELEQTIKDTEFLEKMVGENVDEQGQPMEPETRTAKVEDLKRQRVALQNRLQVVREVGLAVDFVQAEDMQVSTDVAYLSDHLDGDWNANEIYIRTDKLGAKFPRLTAKDIEKAVKYTRRKPERQADMDMPGATSAHGS
jgi:hypothetical protein